MSDRLSVENLHKSFRQGERAIEVLRGVNFEASPGESVAIVGQSGSGKSTLLAMLAGLDRPDQGAVKVGGVTLSSLDEKTITRFRADRLGIVFQQFHLMPDLTAEENVMLPLELNPNQTSRKQQRDLARAELEKVGLGHRMSHFPRQLSGGECQRVAIARALVVKPSLLLADEPTGNLDFETATTVSDMLFAQAERAGAILLLVTHSEELAKRCKRVLRLKQGRIE